jgi:hypothetical protein
MTEDQARKTANVLMAAAALGAAVIVLRNPKLRRITWRLARHYAAGPLAVWAAAMVQESWERSAAARPVPYELPPTSQGAR